MVLEERKEVRVPEHGIHEASSIYWGVGVLERVGCSCGRRRW